MLSPRTAHRLLVIALAATGMWLAPPLQAADETAAMSNDVQAVGNELVLRSLSMLGVRYRFGGDSPETGLDCSGLVQHVFREALGLVLPRRSEEMSRTGASVPRDRLEPGDLVFFNTLRRAFSHVGIYIGDNRFVHAPSSGGRVRVETIESDYWMRRFNGARRVADSAVAYPGLLQAGAARLDALQGIAARAEPTRSALVRAGIVQSAPLPPALPQPPFAALTPLLDTGYAY